MSQCSTAPRFEPLGHGPFQKTHEDFTGAGEHDWDALARADYGPAERERGRRSFVLRALDEQRSLVAFTELLGELCEAGAPIDVISSLSRVVRDEARHVDLCDRVVKALGGWDTKAPEPVWVRSNKKLPLQRRILCTVLGSLCIGETISVAMIRGVREHASDPVAHSLLTTFLADERFHSRFGWWWLEAMPVADADRAFAMQYLERVLAAVTKSIRPPAESLSAPHRYSPYGSMSAAEREDAFQWAMQRTILPGLDAAGLEGTAIWSRVSNATK